MLLKYLQIFVVFFSVRLHLKCGKSTCTNTSKSIGCIYKFYEFSVPASVTRFSVGLIEPWNVHEASSRKGIFKFSFFFCFSTFLVGKRIFFCLLFLFRFVRFCLSFIIILSPFGKTEEFIRVVATFAKPVLLC